MIMWGVMIGIGFGSVQLYLLSLAVRSLSASGIKIWPLVVQFFCPLVGLGLCALVVSGQLVSCAVAMSAVLIGGAVISFVKKRRIKED